MLEVPTNFQDALKDPKWKEAIKEELKAFYKNETWVIIEKLEGRKKVNGRLPLNSKLMDKTKLVVKGYTQTFGIDYQETFDVVAKINTIRILIFVAANLDWSLH